MFTISDHPSSNLDLLHEEVLRQRESMARKMSNTYTRATILVGAAGVLGGTSVATGSPTETLTIALVSLGLFAAAAVLGLTALRPLSGDEVDVEAMISETANYIADDLKRAIISSNLHAHGEYERSLKRRTKTIVAGFIALSLAWGVTATANALQLLVPAAPTPVQVEIVEGQ